MNKILRTRVLPLLLVLVILETMIVPVSAADFQDGFQDYDSVNAWDARFNATNVTLIDGIARYLSVGTLSSQRAAWIMVDKIVISADIGNVSLDNLDTIARQYNSIFNGYNGPVNFFGEMFTGIVVLHNTILSLLMGLGVLKFEVQVHPVSGLYRIKETTNNFWVVNSSGQYPYCEGGTQAATTGGNRWIGEQTAGDAANANGLNMKSLDTMNLLAVQLKKSGVPVQLRPLGTKYLGIWYHRQFWADEKGCPFVCWAKEDQTAINQDRPDTSVEDELGNPAEGAEENHTNIDLGGMIITLPDGTVQVADSIIYDESTKTYHVDSHDTYNTTINNYYTYNFYINYTSVTYIGTTQEYNKYYEVYYELPDGRDSADLTAAELEQLNLDIDVIAYGRSTEDVSLRSLYHFDGDTEDESYWNYCTEFTWNKGASLTYMESGNFDGALYLDETEHDFTLTLPSNIGSGDFTLQFRYYQSHTAAPQTDSYVMFGNSKLLQFDGASLKNANGTVLAAMPVGSWNEIAIVRSGGSLYYYLNGVSIGNTPTTTAFAMGIGFHFGATQQTYKQLDELRFVNQAIVSAPSNYTCTSVPYDTNLSLVLPDSQTPVADEYWNITSSSTNLLDGDFTAGVLPASFKTLTSSNGYYSPSTDCPLPTLAMHTKYTSIFSASHYLTVTNNGSSQDGFFYDRYGDCLWVGGLFSLVDSCNSKVGHNGPLSPGSYTLSVVLKDGSIASCGFDIGSCETYQTASFQDFSWGRLGFYVIEKSPNYASTCMVYVMPKPNTSVDIVYVELVAGESTDLAAEWVTSVVGMDTASMRSPTLAVRTDVPIASYQIGGVRPILPTKGQVWALVEGGYIRSLQIYNGQAWEGCDGRIWTGKRWIPYGSYNVVTLQDLYDIVDATGDFEYIYSEAGFWSWWQKSWNAFTAKLFATLGTGSSGGSSIVPDSVQGIFAAALSSLIEGAFGLIAEVLKSLLSLATETLSFFFGFLTDTVLGGISDFFSAFKDASLTGFFRQPGVGADGNATTSTGLPEGVTVAFSFISGTIMCLPADIRAILFFGLGLMVLFGIFKMVKS